MAHTMKPKPHVRHNSGIHESEKMRVHRSLATRKSPTESRMVPSREALGVRVVVYLCLKLYEDVYLIIFCIFFQAFIFGANVCAGMVYV